MTEQDKVVLTQGIDLQIAQVSGIVLESKELDKKAVCRETIAYLNTLFAKIDALEITEDESK